MASAFAKTVPAEPIGPTELAVPQIESVPDYFKPGGTQEFIQGVAAYCGSQQLSIDSSEGRDAIRSLAHRVTKTKTAMLKVVDDWATKERALLKSVKTESDHLAGELDKIRDRTRKPLTDWENYDKERTAEHETALGQIFNACLFVGAPTIAAIQQRMAQIRTLEGRNWEEYRDRAAEGVQESIASLKAMLAKAELAEAERIEAEATKAELAALKAQMAAREAEDKAACERASRSTSDWPVEPVKEVTPAAFTAVSMMPIHVETPEQQAVNHLHPTADDEAIDALSHQCDLDFDQAADVLNAIKAGKIPHVKFVD